MSFTVVIPARYASSRLPGKPLAMIAGKPMIQHVCERANESRASRVVVATDDARIEEACLGFGAEVIMTSPHHASGTDRLEEVARKLQLDPDHRVVNVQGDEPLIPPELINQVADNLEQYQEAAIATLCERIHDARQVFNPNVVKVVFDARGMAHYFSRAPIPWARDFWPAGLLPRTWTFRMASAISGTLASMVIVPVCSVSLLPGCRPPPNGWNPWNSCGHSITALLFMWMWRTGLLLRG